MVSFTTQKFLKSLLAVIVHLILLHFFPFLAHYGIPLAAAAESHHLISAKTAQLDFSRIAFHLGQLHNAHRSCITGDGEA